MPKINGVGCSSATCIKHQDFKSFIVPYLSIYKKILEKYMQYNNWMENKFYYFDLTAGYGRNPLTNEYGSPILFIKEAQKYKNNFKVYLFEKDSECCEKLLDEVCNIRNAENVECIIINGDSVDILRSFFVGRKTKRYGIVFSDLNGIRFESKNKGVTPFDLLKDMSKCNCYDRLDYLINFPTHPLKRVRGVKKFEGFKKYDKSLIDYMKNIGKKHWCLTQARGKDKWVMIFATNWYDLIDKMKSYGFYDWKSQKGQEILAEVN